jgi:uncharacterized protein YkwD
MHDPATMSRWLLICAAACLFAPPPVAHARPTPPVDAKALVEAHNRVRAKHCAPPLSWSAPLSTSA